MSQLRAGAHDGSPSLRVPGVVWAGLLRGRAAAEGVGSLSHWEGVQEAGHTEQGPRERG